jgi:hypothetical protein
MYFTEDGAPLPLSDPLNLGLTFMPAPLLPGVSALPLGNLMIAGTPAGLSLPDLVPDVQWQSLMEALGLDGVPVNDMHIGMLIDHCVPEPSSLLLTGGALPLRLRRSRRR